MGGEASPRRSDDARSPRPRETIVRPRTPHMGASDSPLLATKISALVHELANVLDGTLRCLEVTQRLIAADASSPAQSVCTSSARLAEPVPPQSVCVPADASSQTGGRPLNLERRLDALHSGLLQMAGLVRAFSSTSSHPESLYACDAGYSLAESVRHAAEVFGPLAFEKHARIVVDVPREFEYFGSVGIFGVLASGIRNAIESIERAHAHDCGTTHPDHVITIKGSVRVAQSASASSPVTLARIDITDDGEGLVPPFSTDSDRAFDAGATTKPNSLGFGLALARDTMTSLGGSIHLLPGHACSSTPKAELHTAREGRTMEGAILRFEWPARLLPRPMMPQPTGDSIGPVGEAA